MGCLTPLSDRGLWPLPPCYKWVCDNPVRNRVCDPPVIDKVCDPPVRKGSVTHPVRNGTFADKSIKLLTFILSAVDEGLNIVYFVVLILSFYHPHCGVLRTQKLRYSLLRSQSCQSWGQNIATHASHNARNFFLFLIAVPFRSNHFSFSKFSPTFLIALVLANAVSRVVLGNWVGHPAHSHQRF